MAYQNPWGFKGGRMKKVILVLVIALMSMQSVFAVSISPLDMYKKKGDTYYLYTDYPPTKYGKCFGNKKDYIKCPKKSTLFKKTWKSDTTKKKVLSSLRTFAWKHKFVGIGTIVSMVKDNVHGVKVEKTTFYNKHTNKYTVGKNRKCRKEIWIISYKMKNGKSFKWQPTTTLIGYHSEIKK